MIDSTASLCETPPHPPKKKKNNLQDSELNNIRSKVDKHKMVFAMKRELEVL